MHVVILSNKDPASSLVFEELCKSKRFKVVGIGFTSTLTQKSTYLTGLIDILRRSAKSYFWYMCFYNGVFLLKEKIFGTIPSLQNMFKKDFFSLRNYLKDKKMQIVDTNDFNSSKFIEKVKEWNPAIIVTRINQILKKEILELPKYGCWCCHSSLLPEYKGIAAEFYNLLNEERYAGFSILKMTSTLDGGDILEQAKIEILEQDTFYSLTQRNAKLGGRLLVETLERLNKGKLEFRKQPNGGKYYSWPDKKAVVEFKTKNKKFIRLSEIFQHIIS